MVLVPSRRALRLLINFVRLGPRDRSQRRQRRHDWRNDGTVLLSRSPKAQHESASFVFTVSESPRLYHQDR